MIFLFEAVPESIVRRYFLQVKKLTFKRAPGSRYAFPTQPVLRQHVPKSGAESGVSGLRKLLGALARALGVLHLAHWS